MALEQRAGALGGRDDELVAVAPLRDAVGDWAEFLAEPPNEGTVAALRQPERTGRPLGGARFVAELQQKLGRRLRPGKPGASSEGASRGVNRVGVPGFPRGTGTVNEFCLRNPVSPHSCVLRR